MVWFGRSCFLGGVEGVSENLGELVGDMDGTLSSSLMLTFFGIFSQLIWSEWEYSSCSCGVSI